MMTTYAALIVSFLGALVGLAGSSWDQKKAGIIKLTPKGWAALCIIILGFTFSIHSTYINQKYKNTIAIQRNAIAEIGRNELFHALRRLTEPFVDMLNTSGKLSEIHGLPPDEYDKRSLKYLATNEARQFFENADLQTKPKDDISGFEYDTYADAIEHSASVAPDEFDRIFTRYANYFSVEEIFALRLITTAYYLTELENAAPELKNTGETKIFSSDSSYIEFFSFVSALRNGDLTN